MQRINIDLVHVAPRNMDARLIQATLALRSSAILIKHKSLPKERFFWIPRWTALAVRRLGA